MARPAAEAGSPSKREYPNGDRYEGPLLNGKRHGKGTYFCANGDVFSCKWVSDRKEGFGRATFANGASFKGLYKANERYFGEYCYPDGSRYKGFWKKNQKSGKGIYFYPNLAEFRGFFLENLQHGLGYFIEYDGKVFEQEWDRGTMISSKRTIKSRDELGALQLNSVEKIEMEGEDFEKHLPSNLKSQPSNLASSIENLRSSPFGSFEKQFSKGKSRAMSSTHNFDTLSYMDFKEELGEVFEVLEQKKISEWTTQEVVGFLRQVNEEEHSQIFEQNQITGTSLLKMTRSDLHGMGIKAKGDVIRLMDHIEKLIKFNDHEMRIKFLKKRNLMANNHIKSVDNKLAHILEKQINLMIEEEDSRGSESGRSLSEPRRPNVTLDPKSVESSKKPPDSSDSTRSWKPIACVLNPPRQNDSLMKKSRSLSLPHTEVNRKQRKRHSKPVEDSIISESPSHCSEVSCSFKKRLKKPKKDSEFANLVIKPETIKLRELLQEGAFGKVYLGSYNGLPVAVKVFKRQGKSKFHVHSFLKEVSVISTLRHPNILLYMGVCIYRDNCLMISEFLENGSLFDHLHRKNTHLEFSVIKGIILDILKAMAYVHSMEFVHCDIKSSNILIDKNWNIKLADFGLSKKMLGTQDNKKSRVGTPNWMSPEVCRGEKFTQKSDVYSFGVVIWEIATKKIPHEGETPEKIYNKVGFHSKCPLPVAPDAHQFLLKLMDLCLRFDKDQRPTFATLLETMTQGDASPSNASGLSKPI